MDKLAMVRVRAMNQEGYYGSSNPRLIHISNGGIFEDINGTTSLKNDDDRVNPIRVIRRAIEAIWSECNRCDRK